MKQVRLLLIVTIIGSVLFSCNEHIPSHVKLKNEADSVSYFIGQIVGNNINSNIKSQLRPELINKEVLIYSFVKTLEEGDVKNMQSTEIYINTYFGKLYNMVRSENEKEGEAFLQKIDSDSNTQKAESGFRYKVVAEGNGEPGTSKDKITISYRMTRVDGSVISEGKKEQLGGQTFPAAAFEAVKKMPEGAKWNIYIPGSDGSGDMGRQEIEPFEFIIFELEINKIEKK